MLSGRGKGGVGVVKYIPREFCLMIIRSVCLYIFPRTVQKKKKKNSVFPRSPTFLLSNLSVSMVTEARQRQVEVECTLWVSLCYLEEPGLKKKKKRKIPNWLVLHLNDLKSPGRGAHAVLFLLPFHCHNKCPPPTNFNSHFCTVSLCCLFFFFFWFGRVVLCVIIEKQGFSYKRRSDISD